MAENDRIVWVDLEMTGLDLERHVIVEIACLITDGDLNPLDAGISLVVSATESELAEMDDFVVNMHTVSGLLPEISSGLALAEAEAQVLQYVQSHVSEARKAPLAGSSIYVDRGFLSKFMPALDGYLHYRLIDVSSIKELARRWFPRVYYVSPEKVGNHRALGDIADSIRELQYYRQTIFVDGSGPSMGDAKRISAELSAVVEPTNSAQA